VTSPTTTSARPPNFVEKIFQRLDKKPSARAPNFVAKILQISDKKASAAADVPSATTVVTKVVFTTITVPRVHTGTASVTLTVGPSTNPHPSSSHLGLTRASTCPATSRLPSADTGRPPPARLSLTAIIVLAVVGAVVVLALAMIVLLKKTRDRLRAFFTFGKPRTGERAATPEPRTWPDPPSVPPPAWWILEQQAAGNPAWTSAWDHSPPPSPPSRWRRAFSLGRRRPN